MTERQPDTYVPPRGTHARDGLSQYFSEIKKVPLLSAEEEVELAKRIEAGLFAGKVLAGEETMSGEYTEEELEWIEQDGKEAYEHFVSANLRLVVSLARKYRLRETESMQFEDLIQTGNEGLFRAVDKFDYTKGYKFSTYATWWIRQAITRAVENEADTIRLPSHVHEKVKKYRRIQSRMWVDLGREPTPEEVGKEAKLTPKELEEILESIRVRPISLDLPIGESEKNTLGDIIVPDESAETGDDTTASVLSHLFSEEVQKELVVLPERQVQLILMRFGFMGKPATLKDIGKEFGLSPERIRQLERDAMNKLRGSAVLKQLFKDR